VTSPAGRATVELDADGSHLGPSIKREVNRALRNTKFNLRPMAVQFKAISGLILKATAAMGALSTAIVGGASAVNVLVAAAAALAPVLGAGLAALPGLVLAGASAMIILKAAIAGVGDAFSAAIEGDGEKFAEAIAKLAPAARAAAVAFRDLVNAAKPVQQAIQQAFFVGIAAGIRNLQNSVTQLRGEAVQVATAMGGIVREALGLAGTKQVVAPIEAVLRGLAAALNEAKAAVGPLIVGFASLAGQAGAFGQDFGAAIAAAGTRFGEFLQGVDLAALFESAMNVLRPLGDLLADLGAIGSAVFGALGVDGAVALGAIGQVVGAMADFVRSAEGAAALNTLGEAMQQIAGAAGQVFVELLKALVPALVQIAPLAGVLATSIAQILVPALKAVAPLLASAASTLSDLFTPLARDANLLRDLAAGALLVAAAIKIIRTAIVAWTVVQWALNVALTANPIGIIIVAIGALIAGIVLAYRNSETFRKIVDAAFRAVGQAAVWLWEHAIKPTWEAIKGFFVGAGRVFAALPGQIGSALNAAFDAGLRAIGVGIAILILAFKKFPGMAIGAIKALPGVLANFFSSLWARVRNTTMAGINAVTGFMRSLPGRIFAAVRSLSGLLTGFFSSLWARVRSSTASGVSSVVGFVRSLPGRIVAAVSALPRLLRGAFNAAIGAARSAAVSGFNNIVGFVRSVPARIAALKDKMLSAGLALIRGLMSGLGRVGGFIGDIAGSITGAIKGFLNRVISRINEGIASVDDALPFTSLPRIPQLAKGGLTTGEGLASLHPRELVLPLEDRRVTDLLARALRAADDRARDSLGGAQFGDTVVFVEIDGQQLQGRIVRTVRGEVSEANRSLKSRVKAGATRR
jgi:phage-related protein